MFDRETYYHIFKSILSGRFSNSLCKSDVLLFLEFINVVSILFYSFIELIILLYTFLVIFLLCTKNKGYIIWLILLSKLSDVLPAFSCASAIGNLWIIWLRVNILSPFLYFFLTFSFKYNVRIILKQCGNLFSRFVKCFNIFLSQFFAFLIFPLLLLFRLCLIFLKFSSALYSVVKTSFIFL